MIFTISAHLRRAPNILFHVHPRQFEILRRHKPERWNRRININFLYTRCIMQLGLVHIARQSKDLSPLLLLLLRLSLLLLPSLCLYTHSQPLFVVVIIVKNTSAPRHLYIWSCTIAEPRRALVPLMQSNWQSDDRLGTSLINVHSSSLGTAPLFLSALLGFSYWTCALMNLYRFCWLWSWIEIKSKFKWIRSWLNLQRKKQTDGKITKVSMRKIFIWKMVNATTLLQYNS